MLFGEATPRLVCDGALVVGLLIVGMPLALLAVGVLEIAAYNREMAVEFVQNTSVPEFFSDVCRELRLLVASL